MSMKERLLHLFRSNGYRLTLDQLLQPPFAAAYRARFSDLRQEGYRIDVVEVPDAPSKNLYVLHEKEIPVFEENGQRLLITEVK